MKQSQKNTAVIPGRTILLVEDDPLIALNQTRLLEYNGYRVTTVNDAKAALEHLQIAPDNFDLVLMDIDLGHGMDGPETAREMLAIREVPIVFLSAHSEKTYVERTHGLESYGFIVKNAGASVLMASLSMAFRLWDSRQLQKAEERQYRVLVESSPDVIMRFDKEFNYLYVSPSVKLLSTEPPEFFIGKSIADVEFSDEMHARWENSISNVFYTASGIEQEIRLQREGKTLDLNWRLIPEKDEHGRVLTVLSIIRDISPQKRAEAYRFQNELRMAFLLDLYSHAALLSEQEISERAVRMARELSGSRNGYVYLSAGGDQRPDSDHLLADCLEKRSQIIHEPDPSESAHDRAILLPVMERDVIVMVLCVSGKRFPYDDTDRAQLQLAANEVYRMISRRRADEDLQESYRQYQSILNTASDGFYMTDESGRIIDANDVYIAMSGYRRSELLKLNITALERDSGDIDSDTRRRLVIAQGKDRHETRQRRKNGRLIDLEISTTYISSSHRFVSFVRDIGERKKAEQAILRMQHLLSETGRIARIGGWEYSLENKHMTWTDEIYRIHDLSVDFEPTLDRAMAFMEGDSLPKFSEAFRKIVEKQHPFDIELTIRTATGRIKWVRAIGRTITREDKLVSIAGTLQDITYQHSASSEAEESTRRLDRFFGLSFDMLSIIDNEGHFVSLNPAWERVTGYYSRQLEGKRFVEFLHPDDVSRTMLAWQDAQTGTQGGFINRFRARDGNYRWIEWRSSPAESLIYTAGRDITDERNSRKSLQAQVERTKSLLELYQNDQASLTEILDIVLIAATRISGSSLGYLHIFDEKKLMQESCYWASESEKSCTLPENSGHHLIKAGIWADSMRVKRPVIHNDFDLIPDHKTLPEGHFAIKRHMGVPVVVGNKVRLIVGVANKLESYEDDDSRELSLFLSDVWALVEQRFPQRFQKKTNSRRKS